MPEFMETNMRQMVVFQKKRKMGGYIVRRKRLAVGPLEDKIILLIFIAAELAIYPLIGFFALRKISLASCVKGKERWLELFFVLSLHSTFSRYIGNTLPILIFSYILILVKFQSTFLRK